MTMTTKIHSPYKEEKISAQSCAFPLSSMAKLGLMTLLALLGCWNLSASTGVNSRRKHLQKKAKKSATFNVDVLSLHNEFAGAVDDDDDDDDDDDNGVGLHESSPSNNNYSLLDEEMRRLLHERNQVGAKRGKVAWLMSFPNSGTSFTSLLVRVASNSTAATNYGMETRVGANGMSVPIYDWSVEGPYWMHPPEDNYDDRNALSSTKHNGGSSSDRRPRPAKNELPHPSSSILTKTHCGGRCITCPPDKYVETIPSFLQMCLSGSRKVPSLKKQRPSGTKRGSSKSTSLSSSSSSIIQYEKHYVTYHPAVVERAIHMIRNPFDNLVSRFHHEQKEYRKKNRTSWTERYTNDVPGFKKWCVDIDSMSEMEYDHLDWKSYGYNQTAILLDVRGVSCHAEFFRYAQWHILAINIVELLDIPVLYVHYEEYADDINDLTNQMLKFLNLDRKKGEEELPFFQSNKDYSAYFTREERASASEFMRRLVDANSSTRSSSSRRTAHELLDRYWVEYDFKRFAAETGSIQ